MANRKKQQQAEKAAGITLVASNRQARRDFEILDTYEAGVMLLGQEVKALREAQVTLRDSYARIRNGEAWVISLHINPYSHAGPHHVLEPDRDRKLLLHRHQIEYLQNRTDMEPLTLVPLRLYFKDGRAKLEIGLARGKKHHDRRQDLAKRDADREAARAIANARRR